MTTDTATAVLEQVDPRELLVNVNIRKDLRLNPEFVASIAEHGVLVPLVGVRLPDGNIRVRFGHRRALAAVDVGLPLVPVVVAGAEGSTDDDILDRIAGQYAENEHRANLTVGERAAAFEQMSAFGLTADQIVHRTKATPETVSAALAVASSPIARAAVDRYTFLSLEHAAVVAEFEDDDEAVKKLVVASRDGQIDHLAARLRDERRLSMEADVLTEELTTAGIRVIGRPGYEVRTILPLVRLRDSKNQEIGFEQHTGCPGHVAWVMPKGTWETPDGTRIEDDEYDDFDDEDDGIVKEQPASARPVWVTRAAAVYGCDGWAKHGHRDSYSSSSLDSSPKAAADMTDKEREKAKAERRAVIDNNKAWPIATTVRREWLAEFAKRKTAPKGTPVFIACAIARADLRESQVGDRDYACELLGVTFKSGWGEQQKTLAAAAEKATDPYAMQLALVQLLAAYETRTHSSSWRSFDPGTAAYLTFLETNGYTLAPVEKLARKAPKRR